MIIKKALSILMVISTLLCVCVFTTSASENTIPPKHWIAEETDIDPTDIPGTIFGILGDTDKNDTINVKDATNVQKHLANIVTIDEIALVLSDVDITGKVNIKDATTIQKWVAGVILPEESYIGHFCYEAYPLDERLFGTWEYTYDAGAQINELLPLILEDPMVSEYINIRSCEVTETYKFFDDFSYTITTDKEDLENAAIIMKADLSDGLLDYMVAITKESGYDITAEELLEAMGYSTIEEYIDDVFPIDMLLESSEPVTSHYRTAPDGKLYLNEFSDTTYELYTIDGDTLTITGDSENLFPEFYPITLKKVN